ncbi:MAG: hypothetical protein CME01_00735, partial [Geminicoccus sp.]|nr:hypothetical protein [Geminicoccus sp.]
MAKGEGVARVLEQADAFYKLDPRAVFKAMVECRGKVDECATAVARIVVETGASSWSDLPPYAHREADSLLRKL